MSAVACAGLLLSAGCSGAKTDRAAADAQEDGAAAALNADRFVVPVGQPMPTGSHVTLSGGDRQITYHFDIPGIGKFDMTADQGAPALSEIIGLGDLSESARQAIKAGQDDAKRRRVLRLPRAQINRLADANPNDLIAPRFITVRGLTFTTGITGDLTGVRRTIVVNRMGADRSADRRSVGGPAVPAADGDGSQVLQIAIGPNLEEGDESLVALIASAPGSTALIGDSCGTGDEATVRGEHVLDETGESFMVLDVPIGNRDVVTAIPPTNSEADVRCFPISLDEIMAPLAP